VPRAIYNVQPAGLNASGINFKRPYFLFPVSFIPEDVDCPPATVSIPTAPFGKVLSVLRVVVLSGGLTTVSTFTVPSLLPLLPQAVKQKLQIIQAAANRLFFNGFIFGVYKAFTKLMPDSSPGTTCKAGKHPILVSYSKIIILKNRHKTGKNIFIVGDCDVTG
jgi:hypothetical protein